MKLQKGTGLANGKIILAGEHAVVYHKPAIALPINAVFVKADIVTATKGQTIECELYSGDLQSMPASMAGLQFAIQKAFLLASSKEVMLLSSPSSQRFQRNEAWDPALQ